MPEHMGLLVGLGFAFAAILTFHSTRRWRRRAVETRGTVVDRKARLFSQNTTWNAVFEFVTLEGETLRVRSNTYAVFSEPEIGDRVRIRYDPSNPRDARIDRVSHLYALPAILMFVAVSAASVWAASRMGLGPQLGGADPAAPPPIATGVHDGDVPDAVASLAPLPAADLDLEALESVRTFSLSERGFRAVALDGDGRLAAFAVAGDSVVVFDLEEGERVGVAEPAGRIHSLAFSPDGEHLAAGTTGRVVLLDAPTGRVTGSIEFGSSSGGRTEVTDLVVSPSGEVAVATAGTDLVFIDLARLRPLGALAAGGFPLTRLAWSPDGRVLASLAGREVVLWPTSDLAALTSGSASCRVDLPGPGTDLAFTPDGGRLAVVLAPERVEGRDLLVVEAETCKARRLPIGGSGVATRIATGPAGRWVLVPSAGGRLEAVPVVDGGDPRSTSVPPGTTGILAARDGRRILAFSVRDGRVTLLERR